MKHRKQKIKRQHGMIKGLHKFLRDNISTLGFVEGIVPGQINVGSATGENLIVRFKYSTISGAKLIARSGSSVQEIFVITNSPEKLRQAIESL